jgi:hypothetical protein
MDATIIVIASPGDTCQERVVNDELALIIRRLKIDVQQVVGEQFQEFVPVSVSSEPNPLLTPQYLEGKDLFCLAQLARLQRLPYHANVIVECVAQMCPLGHKEPAADMLSNPDIVTFLSKYDGSSISQGQANDAFEMLLHLGEHDTGKSLAKFNLAAYILLRWALAWLSVMVAPTLSRQVQLRQASERIVKCSIGNGRYVHVSVYSESLLGVVTGKRINDTIEWFPPQIPCDLSSKGSPEKTREVIQQRSTTWR